MLEQHYQAFLRGQGDWLHAAAHSHHPWPDCTRAAHLAYWEDSVRFVDRKWAKIFGEVVPEAQRHVARTLNLPDPARVAFAPNTHEFVARLYSCLDWSQPLRVLTTANEFHSFARQTRRLEETGRLAVTRVPVEPFATFRDRFQHALGRRHDMVFLSQVPFDSGFVIEGLESLLSRAGPEALVAIDGYHAFMAIPVDLARLADRIFYLAGGYKYAQGGEGACFMAVPAGSSLRPAFTGWFADFAGLRGVQADRVGYGDAAMRFWGSTFDASGLYRFNAVMRWLEGLGVTPVQIHAHVAMLQDAFLAGVRALGSARLPAERLVPEAGLPRGNFCAFDIDDAEGVEQRLLAQRVQIDRRGRRLRFGFGVYHDRAFVGRLLERLRTALA